MRTLFSNGEEFSLLEMSRVHWQALDVGITSSFGSNARGPAPNYVTYVEKFGHWLRASKYICIRLLSIYYFKRGLCTQTCYSVIQFFELLSDTIFTVSLVPAYVFLSTCIILKSLEHVHEPHMNLYICFWDSQACICAAWTFSLKVTYIYEPHRNL